MQLSRSAQGAGLNLLGRRVAPQILLRSQPRPLYVWRIASHSESLEACARHLQLLIQRR